MYTFEKLTSPTTTMQLQILQMFI